MISKFAPREMQKSSGRSIQRAISCAGAFFTLASLSLSVHAGPVASRSDLVALLGGPGTQELFQQFSFAGLNGQAVQISCPVLDKNATCGAPASGGGTITQGPGLVVAGVSFTFPGFFGQWDDSGFMGASSKEILSQGPVLDIDFTTATNAFGVDLRTLSNFSAAALMDVFGPDDKTLIGEVTGITLNSTPVFEGWQDSGGIGRVELRTVSTQQAWSPIIDNLEFGQRSTPISEPSSLLLAGIALALAARRRGLLTRS
jgi:hypothetical protein